MSGARVSAVRLRQLRDQLSGRDFAILQQVDDLRLMSARQIETVHFTLDEHASPSAAARAARRTLERLTRQHLLHRLERRVGGIRAGSASYVYGIGGVGDRLIGENRPRRRTIEPSATFSLHTLAIAQLTVDLTVGARSKRFEIIGMQHEPRAWRTFTGTSGLTVLRPDVYVTIGSGEFEYRWFVEVDLGTEHLPTLLRKCATYEAYYRTGREQHEHGVSPRIAWLMHSSIRAARLRDAIADETALTTALFTVSTSAEALATLQGGAS